MSDTLAKLAGLLREKFDVEGDLRSDSTFEDIGLDSLDVINFLFAVEETMAVKVPDEDLVTHEIETLGRLAEYLDARRAA